MSSIKNLTQLYRRMPIMFGPFPGPRQSFEGHRRDGTKSTSVEAFITFKTTQSALLDLLPTGLSFQNASKEAFVSVAPKRLDKLQWLGGRGYNLLSVYIHGVKYVSPSGTSYKGTFLPVLWEDMADPIISGREELGFPKLYGDLSIVQTEDTYAMTASWQGSVFADFRLETLQETKDGVSGLAPREAGVDEGLILHRYVPTTGQPGIAESDYLVFVAHAEEAAIQPVTVTKKLMTTEGELKWHPRNWQDLPTLHHIIRRLADIPCLGIVTCGVTEKIGWSDLSTARRVDIQH